MNKYIINEDDLRALLLAYFRNEAILYGRTNRDDIFEIAQFASDLGDTVNVVTNGLALPNKIDELLHSAFTNITFSLNAVQNPKIHNISRGRDDAFQRTMDALQNLNYKNIFWNKCLFL